MKIAIRTDASVQIGIGHVMRCLTLAEQLRDEGAECCFVCRDHEGNLIAQIAERGFQVHTLPELTEKSHASGFVAMRNAWLGAAWQEDAEQTANVLRAAVPDWLIVDQYAIDIQWEKLLRPQCGKMMVIDDLADRAHDCDLLLDQNLGRVAADYMELVPASCLILAGPHYALLRPEFTALRNYSLARRVQSKVEHILLSMGGVDLPNATGKILDILDNAPFPGNCRITVVMGLHAPWLEKVQQLAAKMSVPTEVKCNVMNMAQLMADSDLAIGAAGSTSWERCCLGLPTIVVVLADNQMRIASALRNAGAAKQFAIDDEMYAMRESIIELCNDVDAISRFSALAAKVTDGAGTDRVIALMKAVRQE